MIDPATLARLHGKTVALDFDGVLHSYESGWTGYVPQDPPMAGAVETARELLDAHISLVVYTTRAETPEGAAATVDWLAQHGFPPLPVTAGKPLACAYIDDRAVPFTGSWTASLLHAGILAADAQELVDDPVADAVLRAAFRAGRAVPPEDLLPGGADCVPLWRELAATLVARGWQPRVGWDESTPRLILQPAGATEADYDASTDWWLTVEGYGDGSINIHGAAPTAPDADEVDFREFATVAHVVTALDG